MATIGNVIEKPKATESEPVDKYKEESEALIAQLVALGDGKAAELSFDAKTYKAERRSLARAANRADKTLRRVRSIPVAESDGTVTETVFLSAKIEVKEGAKKRGRKPKADS